MIRVFLFEDEHLFPSPQQKALTESGFEVYPFSTPALCPHATESACQCPEGLLCADAIITDVNMPRISGLDFVGRQQKRGCRCNNYGVISAKWSGDDLSLAEVLGCTAFKKPVDPREVAAWLQGVAKGIDPGRELSDTFRQYLPENIAYKGDA